MFCKVQFIKRQADEIFGQLKADNYLAAFSKDLFINKSAYYFSEINALHPFREGNGRTQREFIRELAIQRGYIIRFAEITAKEMLEASIDSFVCNYDKMEALFKKILQ
nr:Fic family protein [uncultured Clostridium sp.]